MTKLFLLTWNLLKAPRTSAMHHQRPRDHDHEWATRTMKWARSWKHDHEHDHNHDAHRRPQSITMSRWCRLRQTRWATNHDRHDHDKTIEQRSWPWPWRHDHDHDATTTNQTINDWKKWCELTGNHDEHDQWTARSWKHESWTFAWRKMTLDKSCTKMKREIL